MIAGLAATCNFEVIRNKENIGLAAVLNTGIRRALANEQYQWIAMFDQGSMVSPGLSEAMSQNMQFARFVTKSQCCATPTSFFGASRR